MDKLNEFAGTGLSTSDSDLVGKCLFYSYFSIFCKVHDRNTKSGFEVLGESSNLESSEMILNFLQAYSLFKKQGLKAFEK